MTNSRRKGARGELELAAKFTDAGFPARRGQQPAGGPDSPDVVPSIPSLHVAYTIILWAVYGRHLRGVAAVAVHAWFVLVIVSVLPIYQHQVIDMAGGAGLAVVAFYAFPRHRAGLSGGFRPRPGLGLRYLVGAGVVGLAAHAIGGWALLGLWPATSLVLVAGAYFGLGSSVFRKSCGVIRST